VAQIYVQPETLKGGDRLESGVSFSFDTIQHANRAISMLKIQLVYVLPGSFACKLSLANPGSPKTNTLD
jgi:hypothetical protein